MFSVYWGKSIISRLLIARYINQNKILTAKNANAVVCWGKKPNILIAKTIHPHKPRLLFMWGRIHFQCKKSLARSKIIYIRKLKRTSSSAKKILDAFVAHEDQVSFYESWIARVSCVLQTFVVATCRKLLSVYRISTDRTFSNIWEKRCLKNCFRMSIAFTMICY